MTRDELYAYFGELKESGREMLKKYQGASKASLLQSLSKARASMNGACEDMCKTVKVYPKCTCPGFEPPDATPGVMTWDELYAYFGQLKESGREMLKKYQGANKASLIQSLAKVQAGMN